MELFYSRRITEVEELFKEIMKEPDRRFNMFRIDINRAHEKTLEQVISMEVISYLGTGRRILRRRWPS